jgi:hypothetical protein
MFGKHEHNGFKLKLDEHLIIATCGAPLKPHKIMYVHPLHYGQYFVVFFKG